MADKPKFDPNLPFEPVAKPKFDPSLPFEAVHVPAPIEQTSNLVKVPLGIATGAAEALNPLAIPHGIETLARAPFQDVDQSKSFFGRLAERFKKADESSKIPNIGVNEIAAGTRAAGDIVSAALQTHSLPSVQDIKKQYSEEKKVQDQYNKDYVSPSAKGLTEAGIGVYSLGGLLKDTGQAVSSLTNLNEPLNAAAAMKAFEATKPLGKKVESLVNSGKAEKVGQVMLDEGIVSPLSGAKKMLTRTNDALGTYGKQIGDIAKKADAAVSADPNLRGISVDVLSTRIENEIIAPLMKDPSTIEAAKKVSNWLENLKATSKGEDLSFKQAIEFKQTLNKTAAQFGRNSDDLTSGAFKDVYHALNDELHSGIQRVLPKEGEAFANANQTFSKLQIAKDYLKAAVGRNAKNRAASLTDYISGGALAAGSMPLLGPKGALIGIAGAVANKVARTRGNQISAGLLQSLAKDPSAAKTAFHLLGTQGLLPGGNP